MNTENLISLKFLQKIGIKLVDGDKCVNVYGKDLQNIVVGENGCFSADDLEDFRINSIVLEGTYLREFAPRPNPKKQPVPDKTPVQVYYPSTKPPFPLVWSGVDNADTYDWSKQVYPIKSWVPHFDSILRLQKEANAQPAKKKQDIPLSVLLRKCTISPVGKGEDRMINGIMPTGMTEVGNQCIPPAPHFLWCEDLETLMVAAELDSGSSDKSECFLRDDEIVVRYQGPTGQHGITYKAMREAEHLGNSIWRIEDKEFQLLEYVPAKVELTEFQHSCRPVTTA